MAADLDRRTEFSEHPDQGLALPPWEERQHYGLLNAIYLTTRRALLAPSDFYGRMPTRLGLLQPLLFALVIGVVGTFLQWMWSLTGAPFQALFVKNIGNILYAPLFAGLVFLLSPLLVIMNVFAIAAILHLVLLLAGGAKFGFEATFRVAAYSSSVALILVLPPFCGNLVILIWAPIVAAIGLRSIHGCESWQAVLAVLVPFALGLLGGISMMLLAMVGSSVFL